MNPNIEHRQKNPDFAFNKIIKLFTESERKEVDEQAQLLHLINMAKKELECANINFESASEDEIIDYYIYNIKACQVKYDYLIRKAKEMGLTISSLKS